MNINNLIDMHTHTNYSDGDLSPQELVKYAIEKNISTLAITDHNTIDGLKHLDINTDIEIINGIELTAKSPSGRMHILGYNFSLDNEEINSKLIELKNNSINSILSIMEQIKKDYNIRFSYEDIKELINANHILGRPDLAKLCVKYGYAKNIQEAFDKYLVDAHNKTRNIRKSFSYYECLELLKKSNALSSLAHPKTLGLSNKEFIRLLEEMIECGLDAIEVYHSTHTQEEMNYYLEIANKYNLLISGGSDFHGKTVKPDIELGTGKDNNLKIKRLTLLDELHK